MRAWNLGAGESSVLALALTDQDCEAILDDRDVRRCAHTLKIGVRGTLGLVVLARKQIGFIPPARPMLGPIHLVKPFPATKRTIRVNATRQP